MKLLRQSTCKFMRQLKSSVSKSFASVGILFLFCCAVFGQEWNWQPFNPKSQPWTVLAPGPMKPDAEAQKSGSKKGTYAYNDFNGFFAVIYRETPKRWLPWKADYSGYVKQVQEDVVTANKGELLKENDFSNRGVSGREAFVKYQTGTTRGIEGQIVAKYRVQRFRMFFSGDRFYIILAVVNENEIESPAINNYFNSFAVNTAPTAVDNSYSVNEDESLTVNSGNGVLSNDKDAEGNKITVSASAPLTKPSHGSLSLNADGSFSYKPEPNYYGTDTFTYKANDGLIDSAVATVTITVKPVNDAPTISGVPATQLADELVPLLFTATGNDIDNPLSSLKFSLNGAPSGASISPTTGAFTWIPTEAQGPGNFTFQVNISDGSASTSATINVTVKEINSAPVLTGIADQTVDELKQFSVTVKGSDSDLPANALTYSLESGAPSGMTINASTGAISWTPTEEQGPNDYSITVRVADNGSPSLSDAKTFKVRVNEVNVAPTLNSIGNKAIDEETPLTFNISATDKDTPANTLIYSMVNPPAGATINPSTGAFSWTPTEEQGSGSYKVTFRVTDNGSPALSADESITITVNEVNKAPVVDNSSVNTDEDTAASIALKATDADLPANTLRYVIVTQPAHGKISGNAPNLTYTPDSNFNGSDSFTFKVNDGSADSNTATVNISIKPVNDLPIANRDSATTEQDTDVNINVIANDTDIDGDSLTLANVSNAVNGKVELVGSEAKFTPNPGFSGTATFSYEVSDGKGGAATGTVTITVNPAKPKP